MSLQDLVIQSQLHPPRPRKSVLQRPRLEARLEAVFDYPLTIVQAGTGYGKSTVLASLSSHECDLFWYSITEPDRDPLLFLVNLLSACHPYGADSLRSLEASGGLVTPAVLNPLLNILTSQADTNALLVLDDFHLVSAVDEIVELLRKLVDYCPPRFHIIISTRQMPDLPDINRWRVKGLLDVIGTGDLAFTEEEISLLFNQQYHYPISAEQASLLASVTEGWTIALQMIWQGLQSGIIPNLDTALQRSPATFDRLFDYLAPEVLARQPAYTQQFLLTTSVLREMDGPACDALLDTHDSGSTLRRLYEAGLFVDLVGEETYRYQNLFHDFLLNLADRDPLRTTTLHRRAAAYYQTHGHPEETLYHLLAAQDYPPAANLIESIGSDLLQTGRLDSLAEWLERLPKEVRTDHPALELLYGDVCRQRALFEEALEHYQTAVQLYRQTGDTLGQSRALRGQAQLYLDTVRPLQAAALLADALELLDPVLHREETAGLLEQLAENKLNFGFPDQARLLHQESLRLRSEKKSTDIYLEARILLRTGKLAEARRLLESYELDEPLFGQIRQTHFHREKQLLLSLLCVLQGDRDDAEDYARQAIQIGRKMQSEYVEAVAYMRLGHALQLDSYSPWGITQHTAAVRCYLDVIEKVRPFKVPRVSLEPLWGLCRAYGYAGDIEAAENYAHRAIEISRTAGDEWIGHLVRLNLGASLAMAGRYAGANRWLKEAAEGLDRVQDVFGWSTAQLWLALSAWWKGDVETALRHMSAMLQVVRENDYDFLLIRRTQLGLRDDQAALPLLLETSRHNIERDFIQKLLAPDGIATLEYHPGYTLWVRTLGPFGIWRGSNPVAPSEWQREKARQLFQLMLSTRGQRLQREQIIDQLWPDLPADRATRDFKVALNALNRVLEPQRPHNFPTFFIVRQGNAYGINPQARLVTDIDAFTSLAGGKEEEQLKSALELYEDDYLPDCRYFDWSSPSREEYHRMYLAIAERLARLYLKEHHWEQALQVCQATLRRDKYAEPLYAVMMQAYVSQGNAPQALALYRRSAALLRDDLGLEPSLELQRLYQLLTKGF